MRVNQFNNESLSDMTHRTSPRRYINICIIDSSKIKYFKDSTSPPILNIICNIINTKIGGQNKS